MRFYLANPFPSRKEVRAWELSTEEITGIELLNPFYDVERSDVVEIDAGRQAKYNIDPTEIVTGDLRAILSCDGIVAIINGSLSYGTIMEIVYAHSFGKNVYIICTNGHEKHPWLRYHAREIFTSLDQFVEWAYEYMKGKPYEPTT